MQYVVLDLEWNQAMSSKSPIYNKLPIHLRGEIIQIGACKLNEDMTPGEEFQIDVKPVYFRKMFHAYAGVSPSAYRASRRIEQAKDLLCHSDLSVEEIAERLHFDNPSYFCRVFKKAVGLPPSTYRKSKQSFEK